MRPPGEPAQRDRGEGNSSSASSAQERRRDGERSSMRQNLDLQDLVDGGVGRTAGVGGRRGLRATGV